MKNLRLIVLLLLFANQASASCRSHWITVWPVSGEIAINSIFIINGSSASQKVIRELNKKHKIYLKSDSSMIAMELIKINEGQYHETQAILKPKAKLIAGRTYTLIITGLDQYEKEEFLSKRYNWIVTNKIDTSAPRWTKNPEYFSKYKLSWGCGPEKFVNFCVCVQDKSPVIFYTQLKKLKTGKLSEFMVVADSSFLSIGHGMCSGEFDFEDGEDYEINFALMDASGNKNEFLKYTLKFISPDKGVSEKENQTPCYCPNIENIKKKT